MYCTLGGFVAFLEQCSRRLFSRGGDTALMVDVGRINFLKQYFQSIFFQSILLKYIFEVYLSKYFFSKYFFKVFLFS